MKKFASLIMAAVLLATMLTVFAVTAFAEGEPIECDTTHGYLNIMTAKEYIIKQDCTLSSLNVQNKGSTLTIPEGVTVTVTGSVMISGTVELNGTLDFSTCSTSLSNSSKKNINIGKTGTLIQKGTGYENNIPIYMTTLSEGNIWIIAIIAVVVIAGVVTLVIVKKKKKKSALAGGENKDEE